MGEKVVKKIVSPKPDHLNVLRTMTRDRGLSIWLKQGRIIMSKIVVITLCRF